MTDNQRILELALKGLEAERQRIDEEVEEIRRQLGGRAAAATSKPAAAGATAKSKTGSHLTPAGRKKLADMMRKRWAERRKAAGATGASTPSKSASKAKKSYLTPAGRKKLS